ncbi:MAG: hypothetical protein EP343_27460 [Deltaproteobacteria bacterium]|nr:MAG: hypothetical protein EP343_27460 [Deltaproteobacteria bacterium]
MQKDPSLVFYKIVLVLFLTVYMWGAAWDSRFRAVVYLVMFGSLAGGLLVDVVQWKKARDQHKAELQAFANPTSDDE